MHRAMSLRRMLLVVVLCWVAPRGGALPQAETVQPGPSIRLVLLVSVDGFRYDYLTRFRDDYTGGLEALLTRGAVFTNAFFECANTWTATGFATMLSGAPPAVTGIIGNGWFDRASGKTVRSTADDAVQLLGTSGAGGSPSRLLVTTIGDELKLASLAAARRDVVPRVIGIAEKDRGAILTVGRGADAAYWIAGGRIVSSTYYFDSLPSWVSAFNRSAARAAGAGATDTNELLVAFAREALRAEHLGQRPATDLLSVSFARHDRIGHERGPHSQEIREISLQLDRHLARLLEEVEALIGLQRTLVVFTSDHGFAPLPELMGGLRMPGGRTESEAVVARIRAALEERFGAGDWIVAVVESSIYLNHALMAERKLRPALLRGLAAETAMSAPRVMRAFTRDQLLDGFVGSDLIGRRAARSFHPQRSGDLEIVLDPYWVRSASGTTHGTPYNYDAHIPLIFMGPGIRGGRFHQRAALEDLAPTLATLLDVEVPAAADGRVLAEMFASPLGAGRARR